MNIIANISLVPIYSVYVSVVKAHNTINKIRAVVAMLADQLILNILETM